MAKVYTEKRVQEYDGTYGKCQMSGETIKNCPLGLDLKAMLGLIADGDLHSALARLRDKVPFPGITGSMCVAPCSRFFSRHTPLICEFERFLYEYELMQFGRPQYQLKKGRVTARTAAIVGAGPSGLLCAHDLAVSGHHVEVFDREPKPGGMLDRAISPERLPRHILFTEMDIFRRLDIRFNFGVEIGRDIELRDLRKDFDALYIAIGAYDFHNIYEKRLDCDNCADIFTFLDNINLYKRRYDHFTVLGSDNSAFHLAIRLSDEGKKVTILTSKPVSEMNVSQVQLDKAVKGRIELLFLHSVENILISGGVMTGIELRRMPSSKTTSAILEDSLFRHETDFLVITKGRRATMLEGLRMNSLGFVDTDEYLRTNADGVYAGGDAVDPDTDFLSAMTDGRTAASNIDSYLIGGQSYKKREKTIRLSPGLDNNIPRRSSFKDISEVIDAAAKILGSEKRYLL